MLLLALDTSTATVTVALHDGHRVLFERTERDAGHAVELLAPLVAAGLAATGTDRTDLTAVTCGVGPGPFTALRVGLMTAGTLAHSLEIPAYGVCSLDVLAAGAVRQGTAPPGEFLVATDARRREVYWARYAGQGARLAGPAVGRAANVPRDGLPVVGFGAVLYPEALGPPVEPLEPSAADLAELTVRALTVQAPTGPERAGEAGLLPLRPLYLRRPDAVVPAARKRVLP